MGSVLTPDADPVAVVHRLVDEVMNAGRLDVIDELYAPDLAPRARRWIAPFLASFSDVAMRVEETVVDGDRVAARFTCAGTHTGPWLGHPPTGRRFSVPEAGFFRVVGGRIVAATSVEDTYGRLRQLRLLGDRRSPTT